MNREARIALVDQLQAIIGDALRITGLTHDKNTEIIGIFLQGVLAAMPTYPNSKDLPSYRELLRQYDGTRDTLAVLITCLLPVDLTDLEAGL